MKNDQVEIIKQYLNVETNYAVIINGEYGIGKTHFFKNVLTPELEKVTLPADATKKFKPIHISLFGIKSIEDVQTAIYTELLPLLKNKTVKLGLSIMKTIFKGLVSMKQAGNLDEYIDDFTSKAKTFIDFKDLVLCFDDIDRKSSSFLLEDIFGFLNNIVENEGAKVIIIAKEDELIKTPIYLSSLKEKVIGVNVRFHPDIEKSFKEIIDQRYSTANRIYHQFLIENSLRILEVLKLNRSNLRSLIFFLEHFKTIFSSLTLEFQQDRNFEVSKDLKYRACLNFVLAICFEYKGGNLDEENFDRLSQSDISFNHIDIARALQSMQPGDASETDESYADQFSSRYFSSEKYYSFKSIFDYVIGKRAFQISELRSELEEYFVVKNGSLLPQDMLLNSLAYWDILDLTGQEYNDKTRELLSYVDDGKLQLHQYLTAFHYSTRFENPLKFNLSKLIRRFQIGINKGFANLEFVPALDRKLMFSRDSEFFEEMQEVKKICLGINDHLRKKVERREVEELYELFESDFHKFVDHMTSDDNKFKHRPFLQFWNYNNTINVILGLKNTKKVELANFLTERSRFNSTENLIVESPFYDKLIQKLHRRLKSKKISKLDKVAINILLIPLIEISKRYSD